MKRFPDKNLNNCTQNLSFSYYTVTVTFKSAPITKIIIAKDLLHLLIIAYFVYKAFKIAFTVTYYNIFYQYLNCFIFLLYPISDIHYTFLAA